MMEQRRLKAAEELLKHSLFGFKVHDAAVAESLSDLRDVMMATCGEKDQIGLLSETIRELEGKLQSRSERFLLAPLQRFEQEMELLLDVGSGDEGGTEDELLLTDDDQEMEECLSLSQDPILSLTSLASPPAPVASTTVTIKTVEEEEVLCEVCCAPDSLENDPIVICEVCGVAVHQTCYRLATVPEGDWYCHPCRQYLNSEDLQTSLIPTHELECGACCTKAGAMAPTIDGDWVHVACSMFLPELYVQDKHASRFQGSLDDVQVVCGLDKLKQRRRLRCCFCKKNNEKGACAQCAVGKCAVSYHALCALRNGIKLRYMEDRGHFGSGCLKHQARFLGMSTGSEDDVENNSATKSDKLKPKRSRKNAWSDEDDSQSDEASDDDNELDSDSDHDDSETSLSDHDHLLDDGKNKPQNQPTPTKMSPPRLLGGSPLRSSGCKQSNRSKRRTQIKLSFTGADDRPPSPTLLSNADPSPAVSIPPRSDPQQLAKNNAKEDDTNSRMVLEANVFAPLFYPTAYRPDNEQDFEYVMVLITNWLGVEVASSKESPGIFLLARNAHNPAILEALDRGVIQNGDEVFAFNDHVLRNTDLRAFKEKVVPSTSLPLRCWFRTKRKSKAFAVSSQVAFTRGNTSSQPVSMKLANTPISGKQNSRMSSVIPVTPPLGFISQNSRHPSSVVPTEIIPEGDLGAVSLGINWPWVFLRSDGKLAMNVFWKSLDSAFFLRKINRRTFSQLQDKVEEMCSVRLSSSHPDYEKYCELLVLPRRERVPRFIVEFRKSREQKQKFLSSDVLVGVSSETKDSETEIDEQTPLEVGTTVNVAKRTWPGMNKLGGVGRIKKVNEVKVTNSEKRFTYNIAYILSGNDKNVERKYISVVDLDTEGSDKNEEMSSTSTGRRQKFEPEADNKGFQEPDSDRISVRVVFTANRTTDEDQLAVLRNTEIGSEPKHRRFQLQFTTANSAVHCERKSKHHGDDIPAKELLMHRHFPIKAPDALVNTCFSSELLSIEDRIGDEVDDDNTDSEDESDEIKSELITLQRQFRVVMESNETVFASLTKKVKDEYASKECRLQDLQEIQWRNYERMYQELETAKRQFDDSDEESDAGNDAHLPGSGTNAESEKGEDSDIEDISFGGMFVNKLKQEGNEVCALCELSGGDFTRTDTEKFVHPQCAMFTPETFFKDGVVHGIDLVDPERRRLKCSICGGRKGLSKIQCTHRKCVRAFHVACAFVNGLLTRDPYYQAWCARHLKTSGMGQFVELPDHLKKDKSAPSTVIIKSDTPTTTPASSPARRNRKNNKQQSSQQKRGRARKDTTPAEPSAKAHSDISSKTNRKRKRKGSTSIPNTRSPKNIRGTRGSSPRCAIVIESEEPRCARRLEIELSDDSDHEGKAVEAWQQGRNPQHVFIEKDVVEVLARDWRGSNKPGGVARVRSVEVVENKTGGKDVFYDIVHVVGAFKEKRVPAKYIRKYSESNDESKT